MNQNAAGTLNQYPNLIELIGCHSGLLGAPVWSDLPIGSDEIADGIPLPAVHDNFLQDEIVNSPLNVASVTGHEAIGQDEIQSPPAFGLDGMSICNDEILLQDEAPVLERMSICSDETTIGQDESGSPPTAGLDAISICSDENFLQDEAS
jgi:hypothetical protein